MVAKELPIASVAGVYNAVVADGNFVDTTMYEGRGAGAGPTASAVVADLIDIARGTVRPVFGIPAAELVRVPALPISEHSCPYYLRLLVIHKRGGIPTAASARGDGKISRVAGVTHARAAVGGGGEGGVN